MADKNFGVKNINLVGDSGTPTFNSPNNLRVNANSVILSTDISIGGKVQSDLEVGSSYHVGIGTTNVQDPIKLYVVGNTNIDGDLNVSGDIEASSFTLNGLPLVDANLERWQGNDTIYTLNDVGIGTSVGTQRLTVDANVSASRFISTVASGIAPFQVSSDTQVTNLNASFLRGKTPPSGDIVGTTDTQTLSNKTLSSANITGTSILFSSTVISGIAFSGSTSGITTLRSSAVSSGILTLPSVSTSDIIVCRNTTDTLTNKTISVSNNTISGITSVNLSASAGILNTQLANSTISGVSLGNNLNSLSFGQHLTAGGSYNGSTSRTVSVAATSFNDGNTIVSRDISGDFSAGTISCSYLNASFDVNSNSDENVKENIKILENSLKIVNELRGVSFDWKETGKPSIGVIAQDVEKILPELVKQGDVKSVNYNGLIAVLIEAVKDLSHELKELKKNIL